MNQRAYDPSLAPLGILVPSLLQVRLASLSKHECFVSWTADRFNKTGLLFLLTYRPFNLGSKMRHFWSHCGRLAGDSRVPVLSESAKGVSTMRTHARLLSCTDNGHA